MNFGHSMKGVFDGHGDGRSGFVASVHALFGAGAWGEGGDREWLGRLDGNAVTVAVAGHGGDVGSCVVGDCFEDLCVILER